MTPPDPLVAALAGRYAIEREIGAGGMATVYLARDLKHNRQVALKVLNPELGAVLGAERFMAEIEVTANLHHPNLLPLFDSGEAAGFLFYVMPFVEGETLRARLRRERQLGVDEAVRIGAAVASALDYAHRHDVIHRDLKPENILMHEGQPLVMDFGIALAVSKAGGARITQTGLSLGTPQYMSPEQATGDHALDARSDIYSLGAVVYELLVGDPPHTGSTVQAVIAKVITEQPPSVRATRTTVPEHVDAAVMTALAKVPADRFATASAFAAALTGQQAVSLPSGVRTVSGVTAVGARRPAVREFVAWGVAVAALGAAGWLATRPTPSVVAGRFLLELPESVTFGSTLWVGTQIAMRRDGEEVVFVGTRSAPRGSMLYRRAAREAAAVPIQGTDSAIAPAFSPDGHAVAFATRNAIKRVPVEGGTPQVIGMSTGTDRVTHLSWGESGTILFSTTRLNGGAQLWALNERGGAPPRLVAGTDSARGVVGVAAPSMLPGGTHALVTLRIGSSINNQLPTDSMVLGVVRVSDGALELLGVSGSSPRYASPGLLLYEAQGIINAVRFSASSRKVGGTPVALPLGSARLASGWSDFEVSENGWMTYASGANLATTTMWAVDRSGKERELKSNALPIVNTTLSPDGQRVAVRVSGGAFNSGDIWVYEIASRALTRVTNNGQSYRPAWSRDGTRIYFISGAGAATTVVSRSWDGTGSDSVHVRMGALAEVAIGPAHGLSALRLLRPRHIFVAPTDTLQNATPFVTGPANQTSPAISPDGNWLAYQSDESGEIEVYVRPMRGQGPRVPISVGGGIQPRWSREGTELFYRGPAHLMSARVSVSSGNTLVVARRDTLFTDRYSRGGEANWFDVFPGGKEFLLVKGSEASAKVYVVANWEKLMGTGAVER
ncbi:MAG: protein kinase [Gemmatimonadetes bacterium]|nr:protein kinase [Gemmatimonadota bacterium]